MTPTPPAETLRALLAYDAGLRMRWGARMGKWIIEKRVDDRVGQFLKEKPCPYKSARGLDLFEGWKDGYDHVLTVAPQLIDQTALVMEHIAEADLWRIGGREALNRKLDALDEAREREAQRAISHFTEAAASEMYDMVKWRTGERVAVHTPEPNVIRHEDGFLIRDRRVTV